MTKVEYGSAWSGDTVDMRINEQFVIGAIERIVKCRAVQSALHTFDACQRAQKR